MAKKRTGGAVQYVLLPARGLRAKKQTASAAALSFLQAAPEPATREVRLPLGDGRSVQVRVVDSIGPDGAKLVEATPDAALAIRSAQPGVRVAPVRFYEPAWARRKQVAARPQAARTTGKTLFRIVSRQDRTPIRGAYVVAFTDFATGAGAQGVTNTKGEVSLALGDAKTIQRVYIYPIDAFWTLRKRNVRTHAGEVALSVRPLDFSVADGLRHYYGSADLDVGSGVTVGIVDTGSGPHPDLVIAGGANAVPGENPGDHADNGLGHGTHVAGIVAARGSAAGARGVAPGVNLRSYRVFARDTGDASNFAIAKAIDTAVNQGCHLVNLSLGGVGADPVIKAAVDDARAAGTLCIAAAGNDGRAPVRYPAADETVIAVSALGRKGTYPADAAEAEEAVPPPGTDKAEYVAAFSNVGPQVDLIAPGVGIISTYLADGYAEISGTSMSCPAVTGIAARLLQGSEILSMKKDAARAEAMAKALLGSATSRGFPPEFEGHGLPQSP